MHTIIVTALWALLFSAAGGIEGRVTVRQLPERIANRYAGAGSSGSHKVANLPVVVFIEGTIAGHAAHASAEPLMAQRDTSFQPSVLFVPTGASVGFPNDDRFFHNVFSYSKTKRFDLGRYPKGESKSVVFDEAGTVAVFCEIHKWMRGAIIVTDNPYYATVREDGSFRISDVPAGKYKVTVWHPERGRKSFDVTVPSTGFAKLNAAF